MSEKNSVRDILKKSKKITDNKIESVKSGVRIPKKERQVLPSHDRGLVAKRVKEEIVFEETQEEIAMDLDTQDEFTDSELEEIEHAIEKVVNDEIVEILEGQPTQKKPVILKPKKEFSGMTYQELYDFAKAQRMRGYSYLNKPELIDFIAQNLNGEGILEIEKKEEIKKGEKNGLPWDRIIKFDENILKTQNKGVGYRQLLTIAKQIKVCPSFKDVYYHWANQVIVHEGANLEKI